MDRPRTQFDSIGIRGVTLMSSLSLNRTRQWLKTSRHPLAQRSFRTLKMMRRFELPLPPRFGRLLYLSYRVLHTALSHLVRVLWWTPLFRGRLYRAGRNTYLYGGLPYISGPVEITLGDDCRVSGQTTISGRTCAAETPQLRLGDNVDIGWMTTIAVGHRVLIGNNVRVAGRSLLAGYPGHPLDASQRAAGLPESDKQVGDIVLHDDVWLTTGVMVMAGVEIGAGTIVAAGSVVTRDLPANVLAAGVPARVIRLLDTDDRAAGDA